jgi:hypothetical protein
MSKTGLAMISDTSEVFTDFLLRLDTSNMIETIRQITCMFDVIDASPKWRPQITSLSIGSGQAARRMPKNWAPDMGLSKRAA